MMDAILFSADPKLVDVNDAISHLLNNEKLYWEVGFRIDPKRFVYPMFGYIHICGHKVEFRVLIDSVIDFSKSHYENKIFAPRVKPSEWLKDWETNRNNIRDYHWKTVLVIKHIEPFSYDTYKFFKFEGGTVKKAPQSYVRVKNP